MSALLRLRASSSDHQPLAAMLLAPAVDLSGDEPDAPNCFLSRLLCTTVCITYHPSCADPSTWADASSVHCDLRGLSPVFLQTGRMDYLYQQAARLATKTTADRVTNWEVDVHDDMPHVFSIFPTFVLPYAQVGGPQTGSFRRQERSQELGLEVPT